MPCDRCAGWHSAPEPGSEARRGSHGNGLLHGEPQLLPLAGELCGPTGLAPLAILFGIIGIVLGAIGRKKGAQPQRTGKTVATSGLVLAILALLLGIAAVAGAATVLVNPSLLDPVQQQFQNLMNSLPTGS